MRKLLLACLNWLTTFGIDPLKTLSALRNLPITVREFRAFAAQNAKVEDGWQLRFSSPCLHDRSDAGGVASGHYFHQDLLVARRIYERSPTRHIDVGSRVDGFVAHVATFREIEVFDIRPVESKAAHIKFVQQDIMNARPELAGICDSLSCLHALEHFGLGRYGDEVDADGYKRGFDSLTNMVQSGGILYLSVPVGAERIEFNGQRVFGIRRVHDLFKNRFELLSFSYVDDKGDLNENVPISADDIECDLDLNYGCGIFELRKH